MVVAVRIVNLHTVVFSLMVFIYRDEQILSQVRRDCAGKRLKSYLATPRASEATMPSYKDA